MNAHACTSDEEAEPPKRMKTRRFRFHAILDNVLLSPTPLCEIYTAEIGDKRDIPKLLSLLPALPYNLVHLKRIKGSQIAICENVSDIPPDKIAQIKNLCVDDFIATKVPAIKAKVRSQYKDTQKHWPSSFHEDKLLEKKLNGSLFDEEQRQRFSELSMKVEKTNGAMFHDPRTKRIIIEVVGSGPTCMDDNALIKHPVMLMTQALAELQYNSNEKDDQYLATGFDAFLALEPCTMCAMALVHCRANRVFFVNPNEKLGALLTKWSLQNSKSINHHYDVYRVIEEF